MKGRAESGLILDVNLGGTTLAAGVVEAAETVWSSRTVPIGRLGCYERSLKNLLALAALGRLLVRMSWRLLTRGENRAILLHTILTREHNSAVGLQPEVPRFLRWVPDAWLLPWRESLQ